MTECTEKLLQDKDSWEPELTPEEAKGGCQSAHGEDDEAKKNIEDARLKELKETIFSGMSFFRLIPHAGKLGSWETFPSLSDDADSEQAWLHEYQAWSLWSSTKEEETGTLRPVLNKQQFMKPYGIGFECGTRFEPDGLYSCPIAVLANWTDLEESISEQPWETSILMGSAGDMHSFSFKRGGLYKKPVDLDGAEYTKQKCEDKLQYLSNKNQKYFGGNMSVTPEKGLINDKQKTSKHRFIINKNQFPDAGSPENKDGVTVSAGSKKVLEEMVEDMLKSEVEFPVWNELLLNTKWVEKLKNVGVALPQIGETRLHLLEQLGPSPGLFVHTIPSQVTVDLDGAEYTFEIPQNSSKTQPWIERNGKELKDRLKNGAIDYLKVWIMPYSVDDTYQDIRLVPVFKIENGSRKCNSINDSDIQPDIDFWCKQLDDNLNIEKQQFIEGVEVDTSGMSTVRLQNEFLLKRLNLNLQVDETIMDSTLLLKALLQLAQHPASDGSEVEYWDAQRLGELRDEFDEKQTALCKQIFNQKVSAAKLARLDFTVDVGRVCKDFVARWSQIDNNEEPVIEFIKNMRLVQEIEEMVDNLQDNGKYSWNRFYFRFEVNEDEWQRNNTESLQNIKKEIASLINDL